MSATIVHSELGLLNAAISRYAEITKKAPETILLKQGGKIAFALSRRLRSIMPGKGLIRESALASLKAGRGVRVRPSVREQIMAKYSARTDIERRKVIFGKKGAGSVKRKGKRLNLQALMVQRELNLRESGRGFLGFAARFSGISTKLAKGSRRAYWLDRYKRHLADAGLTASTNAGTLSFDWSQGNSAQHAAEGLTKPKAQTQIAAALAEVRQDILAYVDRKTREDAQRGLKK